MNFVLGDIALDLLQDVLSEVLLVATLFFLLSRSQRDMIHVSHRLKLAEVWQTAKSVQKASLTVFCVLAGQFMDLVLSRVLVLGFHGG